MRWKTSTGIFAALIGGGNELIRHRGKGNV
jgi:hypothetical protein